MVLVLAPPLWLIPRLLLPPLVRIEGAIVPLLEKLDPLLFDEPDEEELDVLVELSAESEMSLCSQTPPTSKVFVGGTCHVQRNGPHTARDPLDGPIWTATLWLPASSTSFVRAAFAMA